MQFNRNGKEIQVSFKVPKISKMQELRLEQLIQKESYDALKYLESFQGKCRTIYFKPELPEVKVEVKKMRSERNYWLNKHEQAMTYNGDSFTPGLEIPIGEAVGVEIECLIPREQIGSECHYCNEQEEHDECCACCAVKLESERAVKIRVQQIFRDFGVKNTRIKYDGSIREEGNTLGMEFAILFNINKPEKLKRLCDALEKLGANVNSSCGLHVHLDARDGAGLPMSTRLKNALPLLTLMVPKSRLTNQYCVADMSRRGHRYAKINRESLRKYQTIEVRLHSGTTNFEKIYNWARIVHTIARKTKSLPKKQAVNPLQALGFFNLPMELASWALSRIDKFSNTANAAQNERAA